MLTEDEINRIKAEENLRMEVRKQLEEAHKTVQPPPAPPKEPGIGKRVMDFLNSSVGMWLLSSVVLTGGATLIQQFQHQHVVAEQNHQQLLVHIFEIKNRLDNMEYMLRRAKTVGDAKAAMDGLFKSKFPLTPELQNRSLGSLYVSGYSLATDAMDEQAQKALDFVRQLEDSEILLQTQEDSQPLTEADRVQLDKLIKACKALKLTNQIKRNK